MKKTILIFISYFLLSPLLISAAEVTQPNRSGGLRITPRNTTELRQAIEIRKETFEKEALALEEPFLSIYSNQTRLRSGAQNLLIMENMLGKNAGTVREIAQLLNDSVDESLELEEEFTQRNKFKKIFFGQKKNSTDNFLKILNNRKEQIDLLEKMSSSCDCSPETKEIFDTQLFEIKSEQERLINYSEKELKRKGMLAWVINIFN